MTQQLPAEQMIEAAASGLTEVVERLLQEDSELIHAVGGWQQFRPLFFAMSGGHTAITNLLSKHEATLNVFEAAALGRVDELERILRVTPNAANSRRDHYDATPLHAVRDAGVEAAKLLIEAGADVNAVDDQRLTPLHGRAEHGDVEMVLLFIQNGANVHADSCMGTPLHAAVGGFQHEPPKRWRDVADILLAHGADVNFPSDVGIVADWTPLHHAAWRDHFDAVVWLLDSGADVTRQNSGGYTPQQTANYFHHDEIAKRIACELKTEPPPESR